MRERLFGHTREDLTMRRDEKYARQNFMICILPQIFLGGLNEGCCGGRGVNYAGGL